MNEPALEKIIKAQNNCARIVTLYGERYLPIFERLENEVQERLKKQKLLKRAILIGKNDTQNGTHLRGVFNSKTK